VKTWGLQLNQNNSRSRAFLSLAIALKKVLVLLNLTLVLAACGGGGGGGSGSGGGGTPTPTPDVPVISIIEVTAYAGPFITTMGVEVTGANGAELASLQHDFSTGQVEVEIEDYVGAILVEVVDINGNAVDYLDEATNTQLSLGAESLRAMAVTNASGDATVGVTPLTELAVRIAGIGNDKVVTVADAANNDLVAALFGLADILGDVTTIDEDAFDDTNGISDAEEYGIALAILSGADRDSGGVDQTIASILAAIENTGGVLGLDQSGVDLFEDATDTAASSTLGAAISTAIRTASADFLDGQGDPDAPIGACPAVSIVSPAADPVIFPGDDCVETGGGDGGSGLGGYCEPREAGIVPDHVYNLVLGKPTDDSIVASVMAHEAMSVCLTYGTAADQPTEATATVQMSLGQPFEFTMDGLQTDTQYYYQLRYTLEGGTEEASPQYQFHTPRSSDSDFVFTVQADSHLDENTESANYISALTNSLNEVPDFHLALGDTFMTDKYIEYEFSEPQYLAQRYYFGKFLNHSAPLFFALGNHDAEGTRDLAMTNWSRDMRNKYFPNPAPNEFYTGNPNDPPPGEYFRNYYAWEWGNSLFVALDPFAYSPNGHGWNTSLGREQYDWLVETLESSTATFKFVYLHNLVGGTGPGRGGVEASFFYEWGGDNFPTGSGYGFDTERPGWGKPIHDVLVENDVSVVFHGHDHMYIHQERDGIVYQLVPQPGHRAGNTNSADDPDYGYVSGNIIPGSGTLTVSVSSGEVEVEFIDSRDAGRSGDLLHSYTVQAPPTAPAITSASSASVIENPTSTGYTLAATDINGDAISFSISGGADAALFNIDPVTGVLTFDVAPDFDNPADSNADNIYEVTLQASDGSLSNTLTVTISVTRQTAVESLGLTDIDLRSAGAALVADFYAPEPLSEKMDQERSVSWTSISSTPENLTRFSFGEGATTNVFALTETLDSLDASLSISTDLAADTQVSNDLLLRSMFQFVEVASGQYAIYSTKHGNYALDVAADGVSLILRDVRSVDAYNAGTGSFLTFAVGASPLVLTANGRYTFDAVDSAADNTLAFDEDLSWTDKVVVLNGTDLELAGAGGTSMVLYEATIGLEIPFDFNPREVARQANAEFYDPTRAEAGDGFAGYAASVNLAYAAQVTSPGIDTSTLAAAQSMLDEIDVALATQGSQTRYPQEYYLALRDGLLRRQLLAEEANDGEIGDLTVPYVYFTNETDSDGNYHPHMVITTHGVPDALALLGDVPHPPGDGLIQGYANQNVTRNYFLENFVIGVPMRDYGEVATLTENDLATQNVVANPNISLAGENNVTVFDHHNYASTNESAVAVDGVVVFPSYNNTLHFSQESGELSARGMHSGRGLGVHYHADPHSAALTNDGNTDTGLHLYNDSDYIGHDHPPIVSIGFDGVAGYGFYLDGDTTSDGVNVALDDFGGHEHDDYGYHYHALRTDRQADGTTIDYTSHELGPLGAWAGRINYLPEFRPRGNSIWLGR
jgi:hypothetical protein